MDGYDQLWSLVEADGADGVPGLIDDARSSAAEHVPVADLQVDVSALGGFADEGGAPVAVLAGSWSAEDDFFPIHAAAAFAGSALPGGTPSTGDTPLVLPAEPDVVEVPEPLVLPGLMADEFVIRGNRVGRELAQRRRTDCSWWTRRTIFPTGPHRTARTVR